MADAALLRRSIVEVSRLIQSGEVSPVELTELSLAAIERANPVLNAFRTTTPDRALAQARAAENEIRTG
ncbi:MAG TPA: Asp-tRNA(Asn)/Glu-tRNA(Gln) amidotransferase subunit GatA, partial [Thermomicrobiales bacterium]|nr:Asp-tRNA(Asn)/Glu-tRNA(Gln) amidotransferase subunit GatA [Thermomicrobiales bacterium]